MMVYERWQIFPTFHVYNRVIKTNRESRVKHDAFSLQIFYLFQSAITDDGDNMCCEGILKGEVSLYRWPPIWLVWNQLYENWQFLFSPVKQTNPNQSNRRSMVQWYFPLEYSLVLRNCPCEYLYRHSKEKKYEQLITFFLLVSQPKMLSCL